jgi:thioredoxin 1
MIRIIYFGAAWCGPCHAFGPLLREVAPQVEYVDLDTDTEDAAQQYRVLSVPTVIVLRDGEVVDRFGVLSASALRERLAVHG